MKCDKCGANVEEPSDCQEPGHDCPLFGLDRLKERLPFYNPDIYCPICGVVLPCHCNEPEGL